MAPGPLGTAGLSRVRFQRLRAHRLCHHQPPHRRHPPYPAEAVEAAAGVVVSTGSNRDYRTVANEGTPMATKEPGKIPKQ